MTQDAQGRERRWLIAMMRRKSGNGLVAVFSSSGRPSPGRWRRRNAAIASVSGLDHIVVHTTNPERAVALYGGRLGLDLRLDRSNEQWGARQLFFRCGGAVVEVGASLTAPRGRRRTGSAASPGA